jgi:hypothetical protein
MLPKPVKIGELRRFHPDAKDPHPTTRAGVGAQMFPSAIFMQQP